MDSVDYTVFLWYNDYIIASSPVWKGGVFMVLDILVSILANVMTHIICKWLDRREKR